MTLIGSKQGGIAVRNVIRRGASMSSACLRSWRARVSTVGRGIAWDPKAVRDEAGGCVGGALAPEVAR